MGCNCGGASKRRAITVSTANGQASVSQAVPGMPRYRVSDSEQGTKEFATYQDARVFRAQFGGKLRAL